MTPAERERQIARLEATIDAARQSFRVLALAQFGSAHADNLIRCANAATEALVMLRADRDALAADARPLDGVARIAAERRRQVEREGWTPAHDDEHGDGSLPEVAACYALAALDRARGLQVVGLPPRGTWPASWHPSWWKPSDDPVRSLEKAGALIAAEIDRLLRRAECPPSEVSRG